MKKLTGRVERNVDKQIFHNHKLTLPQSVVVAHGRARRGLIAWLLDELLLDRPDFRGLGANVDVGALFGGFGYVVLVGGPLVDATGIRMASMGPGRSGFPA